MHSITSIKVLMGTRLQLLLIGLVGLRCVQGHADDPSAGPNCVSIFKDVGLSWTHLSHATGCELWAWLVWSRPYHYYYVLKPRPSHVIYLATNYSFLHEDCFMLVATLYSKFVKYVSSTDEVCN